ncbi:response regulator [Cohnella sp. WQ 127256]|uniref:response regulator n=1 Tax=Cohnella sp. WQ 127256 TaxID=2938790 RepID=UPI002119A38E|nr:response regulator [Cohnella sp. WQ 127256]
MTIQIAIIDDEYLVRKSVQMKISNPNYQVAFESDHGQELLNYLECHGPYAIDLVFVDIVMPLMNGLELVRALKRLYPDLLIIMLSAHNDFEYLQQAILLEVDHYLLKPIDAKMLNETLQQFVEKLTLRDRKWKKQCLDEMAVILSSNGNTNLNEAAAHTFKSCFSEGYCLKMALIGNWNSESSWFDRRIHYEWGLIFPGMPNLYVWFERLEEQFTCSELGNIVHEETITVYSCARIDHHEQLWTEVKTGLSWLKSHLMLGCHVTSLDVEIEQTAAIAVKKFKEKTRELLPVIMKYVAVKNDKKSLELISELFTFQAVPQQVINDSWNSLLTEIRKGHPIINELFDESVLYSCDNTVRYCREMLEFLQKSCFEPNERSVSSGKEIVKQAMDYIVQNYMNTITLSGIAEHFFINRSHLSRTFKQVYGKTFQEIITEIRVKKACELIRIGNKSVGEVSAMVGYEDNRYFSQVFYKSIGMTPSSYKQRYIEKIEAK